MWLFIGLQVSILVAPIDIVCSETAFLHVLHFLDAALTTQNAHHLSNSSTPNGLELVGATSRSVQHYPGSKCNVEVKALINGLPGGWHSVEHGALAI